VKIWIERDYSAMSRRAAEQIAADIQQRDRLVLGLATGSTPLGVYQAWQEAVHQGRLRFANTITFNLDEYTGLSRSHPQSYWSFMKEHLFDHVDLDPQNLHMPRGDAPDLEEEGRAYERAIAAAGGIDIQLLGIGRNGHIGFNEPGSALGEGTHVVSLSDSTRAANARFFERGADVPTHAITMGLRSIMNARQIVLLASGESKSDAVAKAILGDVTPQLPASVLQLHPNCLFVLDEAAASGLPDNLHDLQKERTR